ncbi:MAG TPA: type II toxin-antitoxin system RelE/ParE family toxin [Longimicrobium sp.]|jgi:hypothetical protein
MDWAVKGTLEFDAWYGALTEPERKSVIRGVHLLERFGPRLRHPYCSRVFSSRHANMRELRIQHEGRPYRVLYAFDPRRTAVLLLGGDKTGDDRWYEKNVPIADRLLDEHLNELGKEDRV